MSTPQLSPGLPSRVGVLGGGRMGAGIAHAFLVKGADVLVIERDEQSAEAARERVESAAAKSIERGAVDANLDELCHGWPWTWITTLSRTGSWWSRPCRRTGT
jgi:3-hydroxybutyryl-CoA dehydrogenase